MSARLTVQETADFLRTLDGVLILTHVRPDGDTVGCAAALCRALRALGRTAYLLENPDHKHMQNWVKKLLHIYQKNPALYELDSSWGGFEWINANDAERSIFSFIRKSKDGKNNLLFVCNFTPVERSDYRVGVPKHKTYKLILNSDDAEFGGSGKERPVNYKSVSKECDGRPYSFAYPLPGFGVAVFRY